MRKTVFDIPIDWISREDLMERIGQFIRTKKPHQITTVNAEFLMLSFTNSEFKQALQEADLATADGTGVVLAQTFNDKKPGKNILSRFFLFLAIGFHYLLSPRSFKYERITGVELSERVIDASQEEGWRIFLLGGLPGIASQAAEIWQKKYPKTHIVGTSAADPHDRETIEEVVRAKPDILLVAYGAPKQDLFIWKNKHRLNVPVMVGVGGTFDTVTGHKYNPPTWIKFLGLEWLTYLIRYPSRFRRIWRATVGFVVTVVTHFH